jgi:hypothetical protein
LAIPADHGLEARRHIDYDLAAFKLLPDGREVFVYRIMHGHARISVGPANFSWLDDTW